ncbi:MAG: type III-B CRISPR module-associated protein Cmr5 [gamma proteobacterium symbiont of Ctena orbiculata]|nr:MAG: type III-B CRISPR module-associated protein Cmr5 [gamma proteobacterium symbiont of Ctena orbiculata]
MNIERERAANALEKVESLPKGDDEKCQGNKYTSYVKGLPASILQNGLGQAMATLLAASKGKPAIENNQVKDAHRLLYNHMQAWLCRNDVNAPYPVDDPIGDEDTVLLNKLTGSDEASYIRAQAEALAYLNWLKKFAVAFCPDEGGSQ